jgi:Mrp family chromosome partitioning ATPase
MAGPDASIVSSHVDGTLLVVTPHKNRRRVVLRAAADLRAMNTPLIGVVANQVDAADGAGYYGYGYGYGYAEAYGHEDADDEEDSVVASPSIGASRTTSEVARRSVRAAVQTRTDDAEPWRQAG